MQRKQWLIDLYRGLLKYWNAILAGAPSSVSLSSQ